MASDPMYSWSLEPAQRTSAQRSKRCNVMMVLSFAISENFCVLPASRSVRHWSIWPSATSEIWVVLVVLVLLSQSLLVLSLYGHSLLQN